jgi:hypothetical protein
MRARHALVVAAASATSGWLLVTHPGVLLVLIGVGTVLALVLAALADILSRVPKQPARRDGLLDRGPRPPEDGAR